MLDLIKSFLGGIFYRLGGAGKTGDSWDFIRHTLIRDLGTALMQILVLYPANFWGLLLTFLASFGTNTIGYGGRGEPKEEQSKLYRIFGKYTFIALGFIFGLALIPYAVFESAWTPFIIRTIVLTIAIPLIHKWSKPVWKFDTAQVEEFLRGFVLVITCLIF